MTELPVAGYSPKDPPEPQLNIAEVAADIAETIKPDNPMGEVNVRVGVVTAVESSSPYRVQLDITGTAWLSRTADANLRVSDKAWAMQQGEVVIVAGKLNSIDAFAPIGAMLPYAGSSAPSGWLLCNGASVLRDDYPALYAVCGTTYGSVDGTHFNLPNLQNRVPVGSGGTYSRGGTGGAATVALTTANLPAHDHGASSSHTHTTSGTAASVSDHTHPTGLPSAGSGGVVATGSTSYAQVGSGSTSAAGGHTHTTSGTAAADGVHTHTSVGSGTAHENMPPYLAIPYIIRAL